MELQERNTIGNSNPEASSESLRRRQPDGPATNPQSSATTSGSSKGPGYSLLKHLWSQNVSLVVVHENWSIGGDPRDYLALERSFLGWLRTSIALVSFGIVITQLFILQNLDRQKGVTLGSLIAVSGILVALAGCARYFRQQRQLILGKAISGGGDIVAFYVFLICLLLALFVIVLAEA